jgi:hypothetical protein
MGKCACPGGGPGANEQVCNGMCTNLNTDRNNCGMCGTACGMGHFCFNGKCN